MYHAQRGQDTENAEADDYIRTLGKHGHQQATEQPRGVAYSNNPNTREAKARGMRI